MSLFGKTAKQWRDEKSEDKGNAQGTEDQLFESKRDETRFAFILWNISESINYTAGSLIFRAFRGYIGGMIKSLH
jgi:hypothetical protein